MRSLFCAAVLWIAFSSVCVAQSLVGWSEEKIPLVLAQETSPPLTPLLESPPEPSEEILLDPLEPLNRVSFEINDKLYFWFLKPVATVYGKVVPQGLRLAVRNFFSNLTTPIRFVNCALQGEFTGARNELARLAVNSTFGLLGFMDPAKEKLGIPKCDEDFGQTLGFWGSNPGIYIEWPLLGPSSLRDTIGLGGDLLLDPRTYLANRPVLYAIRPFEIVNDTSLRLGEYEDFKEAALDPYIAKREAYHQYRLNKIRDIKKPSKLPSSEIHYEPPLPPGRW